MVLWAISSRELILNGLGDASFCLFQIFHKIIIPQLHNFSEYSTYTQSWSFLLQNWHKFIAGGVKSRFKILTNILVRHNTRNIYIGPVIFESVLISWL